LRRRLLYGVIEAIAQSKKHQPHLKIFARDPQLIRQIIETKWRR